MRPPSAPTTLDVRVCDSALDPTQRRPTVYVQGKDTKNPLYRVRIYLEGDGLPFVRAVTYHLHHTFEPPRRRIVRTVENPHCELVLWTWGIFTVRAEIEDKRGGVYEVEHRLTYGEELQRGVALEDARAVQAPTRKGSAR